MAFNTLAGLRETLPKSGQRRSTPTLNSLMQRYSVNQPAQGAQPASVGSQGTQRPQNALAVGSQMQRPRDGGPDQPGSMTSQQAQDAAQVGNAMNAGDVASTALGMGSGIAGKAAGLATNALSSVAGPYGVTGMPTNPQVGTPAFAQATPAQDTAPGFTDAGAQAAAMNSLPGPVATGMGAYGNQVPDLGMRGLPSMSDIATGALDSIGLGFADEEQSFGGVASNVGASNMSGGVGGGLQGFADRGFGTQGLGGLGGGGSAGGRGGGTATGNAMGGPDGVGRGNDRGGGAGF